MRIVHAIDSGGLYGAEAVLMELASEQQGLGHSVTIASIGTPGCTDKPLEKAAEGRGLRVARVRMMDGPNPRGALRLIQLARRERADVLHSHGYKPDILLGFAPRRLRGIPLVSTMHGFTYAGGFNRMAVYRWMDLRALNRCDRVVLVHRGMSRNAGLDRLDDPRWRVIENGIGMGEDRAEFAAADEPILQFCRHRPIIGAVGRLSPEKGFDGLLAAFRRLVESGSCARLLVLGEGPERVRLRYKADQAGLSARVLFPGFVDARRYLRLFDVFVLPSLTEGLPITLLEAMRASVPVVASNVGGVPGVLQDGRCGVLVPPGDVPALANALERVLANRPEAERLATRARLAVHQHYSSSRMAARYLELYSELLVRSAKDTRAAGMTEQRQ